MVDLLFLFLVIFLIRVFGYYRKEWIFLLGVFSLGQDTVGLVLFLLVLKIVWKIMQFFFVGYFFVSGGNGFERGQKRVFRGWNMEWIFGRWDNEKRKYYILSLYVQVFGFLGLDYLFGKFQILDSVIIRVVRGQVILVYRLVIVFFSF